MNIEFRLLHNIVSKALCANAGSFDMVTSEKFDLMVAISAGLEVNWAQILFNTLIAMVNNPSRQSPGYAVQISVMLGNLVKADLGESVKLHPQKVLTDKSVATYVKKNLKVTPVGESKKQTEDTASNTEGGESQIAQTMRQTRVVEREKVAASKQKEEGRNSTVDKRKKKLVKKMVLSHIVEARSIDDPTDSSSQPSLDLDSRPRSGQKKRGGTKRKQVIASSDSESTISLPIKDFAKKKRTQRPTKQNKPCIDKVDSQPGPIPVIPAGGEGISIVGGPEVHPETHTGDEHIVFGPGWHERTCSEQGEQAGGDDLQDDRPEENQGCDTQMDHGGPNINVSNHAKGESNKSTTDGLAGPEGEMTKMDEWADKDERLERDEDSNNIEKETDTNAMAIIVRSGPEQPAQKTITYTGQSIFAPIKIREINWATHFLPKIAPESKGKGMLEVVARLNPVEEHCRLVLNSAWEAVSNIMVDFDEWIHFRTAIVAPEASLVGVASDQSQTHAFEFSTQARESAQRQEQLGEVVRSIVNIEEPADETGEHQAPNNERQAHGEQIGETQDLLGGQLEQPSSGENPTQLEDLSVNNADHVNNMDTNPISEENNTDHQDSDSSHTDSQHVFVSSTPGRPHTGSKLEEVENIVASLDSRIMSIDSIMLSMVSKVKSMDSRLGSMDSKIEQLLNLQSFIKHEIGPSRRAFYVKIDTMAGNVKSSQTSLKTTILHHLTEHQIQLSNKIQLEELVDHLKQAGDAKKGKSGQSGNRSREGSGRQGEGPSSTRGKGPSPSYRRDRWSRYVGVLLGVLVAAGCGIGTETPSLFNDQSTARGDIQLVLHDLSVDAVADPDSPPVFHKRNLLDEMVGTDSDDGGVDGDGAAKGRRRRERKNITKGRAFNPTWRVVPNFLCE
ncbi:hypothetical protein F511_35364 [Dorcoceras hygrometricum]|uniref:Uncharacterized protein n=1 Tax=Dorcoceras hygrometricum TaxID=472368 RepID=A0A2Z7AS88_9LAMI|nr:hypothetical protein F511_35364 [Dorcoceras hygrometricum]